MSSSWTRRVMGVAIAFATFLVCLPAFAQTGGLTGKCTGQDGKPLVGYVIRVERTDIHWSNKTKTNKKGEYVYIGLQSGQYTVTIVGPDGKDLYSESHTVGIGDPTEVNEVERMEWVPMASVPGLIAAGQIWNSGTLIALMRLLAMDG